MPREGFPITPSVLTWAINESGIPRQELAERIGVDVAEIGKWENNESKPLKGSLDRLANVLGRPVALFFLPEPPAGLSAAVEFRHPHGSERNKLSGGELRAIRDVCRIQRTLHWISEELEGVPLRFPRVEPGSEVEDCARGLRSWIDVRLEEQFSWKDSSRAFKAWRSALESKRMMVFVLPLGKASVHGFSVWDEFAPAIAVNSAWNHAARTFSLFHELAHMASRTSSACDLPTAAGALANASERLERWCERVAAATLVPTPALDRELAQRGLRRVGDLDVCKILANRFNVSLRAMTLRLIEAGRANWALYSEIPVASDEKSGGFGAGGRTREVIREDQFGERPKELFVRAMREDIISRLEVLRHLDVSDSDLDSFAQFVH